MRPLRIIAFVSIAIVISLPAFVSLFISPAFTMLVEDNAMEESLRVASHLSSMLISNNADVEKGLLPPNFNNEAEKVKKDFNLMRIKVFTPTGKVIYSSDPAHIGEINREEYFRNTVAGGRVYSKVARKTTKTLEGETADIDVAETYIPIMSNQRFAGAFEIYYDISGRIGNLKKVMTYSYGVISITVLCLLGATISGLYWASRGIAERDLARKEWERTFDAVTDPIMILDSGFRMMRVNKAMAETMGVTPEQAVGQICYKHVHCTEGPIPECPHQKLLRDGRVHFEEVYEQHTGKYHAISVFPIYDSAGNMTATVHYARDITKRKIAEKCLREAEAKYRIVADNTYAWEFWISPDTQYLYTSPSCERVTGYMPDDFAADPKLFAGIVHTEDRQRVTEHQHTALEKAQPGEIDFRIVRRDGAIRWISHICQPIFDAEGRHLGSRGSNNDITDRKRTEDMLQRQLRNMTALNDIGIAISSSHDMRVTLNMLLERLASQLEIDAADVLLLDQDTLYLNCVASLGFRTPSIRKISVRLGKGYAGKAAYERRLIIVSDLGDTLTHALRDEDFRSYVGVPLIAQGKVKGVLEIFHRKSLEADDDWLGFLELMAAQAAIAIENVHMFNSLQRSNTELTLSYDATLKGWGRTLELRDEDTNGHTERVARMTVRFARILGVEEKEIVHIRRGALLHDIGKIGIPDTILRKPQALSHEESEIMQRHPGYAYELLSSILFLKPAIYIPFCHHEKWDGTGYPRGLKGEEIPLAARIFSIVDVWDALLSERPYRPAWPHEKVKEYIRSRSGTDFDPALAEVFLRIMDKEGYNDQSID